MQTQTRELRKYRIPFWALYYFTYADASGLTDKEESAADAFFEREELSFAKGAFDSGEPKEPEFYPYNDITKVGEDCVEVEWIWFE